MISTRCGCLDDEKVVTYIVWGAPFRLLMVLTSCWKINEQTVIQYDPQTTILKNSLNKIKANHYTPTSPVQCWSTKFCVSDTGATNIETVVGRGSCIAEDFSLADPKGEFQCIKINKITVLPKRRFSDFVPANSVKDCSMNYELTSTTILHAANRIFSASLLHGYSPFITYRTYVMRSNLKLNVLTKDSKVPLMWGD